MEVRCGPLLFSSKFDSGNLAKVERVSRDNDVDPRLVMTGQELKPDYEYQLWTKPDCAGTEFENGNRTWFYFSVRGYMPGRLIKLTIMNMNKQSRLYSQGYSPLVKLVHPSCPHSKWQRLRDRPTWETVEGQFQLTFVHRFADSISGGATYFAFCFPWSYAESQALMNTLDLGFKYCSTACPEEAGQNPGKIYYHRELLCYSLDKLRIDLITVTDYHGIQEEREPRFDRYLFPDTDQPRCHKFVGKKVYMVSSRVHPGETPASHVFNGLLEFILREHDPRAQQLRRQYIFKLIPMLNPDGVVRGHYRTDARGENLNRVYLDPDPVNHSPIYASKAILVYHHVNNRIKPEDMNLKSILLDKPVIHNKNIYQQTAADISKSPFLKYSSENEKSIVSSSPNKFNSTTTSLQLNSTAEQQLLEEIEEEGEQYYGVDATVAFSPRQNVFSRATNGRQSSSSYHSAVIETKINDTGTVDQSNNSKTTGSYSEFKSNETVRSDSVTVECTNSTDPTTAVINYEFPTDSQHQQFIVAPTVEEVIPQTPVLYNRQVPKIFKVNPAVSKTLVWNNVATNKSKSKPEQSGGKIDRKIEAQENLDGLSLSSRAASTTGALKPAIVSVKFSDKSSLNSSSSKHDKHIGNEGSDDEGSSDEAIRFDPSNPRQPHLCRSELLQISPCDSGIAFYVDLHGHCSRRGCFIYGNCLDDDEAMLDNMLFPRLIALNTAHFDFTGCNFTVKNMYMKDKRDGASKEGAGRVAIAKHLGIVHSYTLECNYNTGRMVNHVPMATRDGGRATPPPEVSFPPKYTQVIYEEVGRAMAIAALDMTSTNPWARLPNSEFVTLHNLRESVRRYYRNLRGAPRNNTSTSSRNNGSTSSSSVSSNNGRLPLSCKSTYTSPVLSNSPSNNNFSNTNNSRWQRSGNASSSSQNTIRMKTYKGKGQQSSSVKSNNSNQNGQNRGQTCSLDHWLVDPNKGAIHNIMTLFDASIATLNPSSDQLVAQNNSLNYRMPGAASIRHYQDQVTTTCRPQPPNPDTPDTKQRAPSSSLVITTPRPASSSNSLAPGSAGLRLRSYNSALMDVPMDEEERKVAELKSLIQDSTLIPPSQQQQNKKPSDLPPKFQYLKRNSTANKGDSSPPVTSATISRKSRRSYSLVASVGRHNKQNGGISGSNKGKVNQGGGSKLASRSKVKSGSAGKRKLCAYSDSDIAGCGARANTMFLDYKPCLEEIYQAEIHSKSPRAASGGGGDQTAAAIVSILAEEGEDDGSLMELANQEIFLNDDRFADC